MEEIILFLVIGIVALAIGLLIGYALRKVLGEKSIGSAEIKARNLILDAENKGETIKKEIEIEAKEKVHRLREKVENEAKEQRIEFKRLENRLLQKEESIDKKLVNIEEKEENLQRKEQSITDRKKQVEEVHREQLEELQRISGYSIDQAKDVLLEKCKSEVTQEASQLIKDIEGKAREEAEKNAKEIIINAVQRCAADHIAETTVSVVNLPNDEMKGRIIGREGRNIRAIETATGIDIIIDDTPEAIILSGFDPVRREVARMSIEKLIVDGRIHPAKIEEVVLKSQKEVENMIKEAGEQATYEVGIYNLHPALIKLMGRLKYRTSYGQNVLKHSIEVSHLAGLMATELGCNVNLAKRAGFLHDIGKAVDHEVEGTHVEIGIDLLKKYKESYDVIDGMKSHHGDYEHASLEAVLVTAADALSAARPGARRETLEKYIKRLKSLEKIANTTQGVEKSFAIQAGREIRIIANPDKTDDKGIAYLARDIAKKIEAELQYPGEIKVNVIRETRAVEHAK